MAYAAGGLTFNAGSKLPRPKPRNPNSPYPPLVGFPPPGTYDPSYYQQAQAAQRGLQDLSHDTTRGIRFEKQDRNQALRALKVDTHRQRQDFATGFHRGMQKIRYSKQDTQKKASRGRQDFSVALENLRRRFTTLGGQQSEAANQQNVLDQGTLAASAERRKINFAAARSPLDTGLQRLNQDTHTALGRLGTSQRQLRQDTRQSGRRLSADTHRAIRLDKQSYKRKAGDLYIKAHRGKREEAYSLADLAGSARYNAYQTHPGRFAQFGPPKKHKKKGKK